MYCRSISWLICMFMAVFLATRYRDTDSTKERPVPESVREATQGAGEELGALLDAGDGAVVTLEGGGARLAVHRAVLAARSPALESMLPHYSDQLSVPGVGGAALRHLLAYLYTLRAPRLPPGAATQLLAAAHRLGLPALQADCERQVAEQLSVETAASAAVLAVELSLRDLGDAAINFIEDHRIKVLATKGWADALENRPKEAAEVSRLLADRLAEICVPATMGAGTTVTTEAETTATIESETTATIESETTVTMEAETTATTLPHSEPSQPPVTETPPSAACPTSPLDEDLVFRLRSLPGDERNLWLVWAAGEGKVMELRALLAAGAHAWARAVNGWTALHVAALQGHAEAASCLLEAGARVDAKGSESLTTPLHEAARSGHVDVVRLLLAASADPNAGNSGGDTPLHYAAMQGHAEAASCLLAGGARADAGNRWLATPLHEAAKGGHVDVVRLLLAASADLNSRSESGSTPLHLAALNGQAAAAAVLLEAGADKGARDNWGLTPLDDAKEGGHHHIIEMLTQR